jgi:hypothetical protein
MRLRYGGASRKLTRNYVYCVTDQRIVFAGINVEPIVGHDS